MEKSEVSGFDSAEKPFTNLDELKGGSKKRKSRGQKRNKKTKSYKKGKSHKKTKDHKKGKSHKKTKKSPSTWIVFVKKWSASNNCSYRDALRNPKCKLDYHKSK